MACINIKNPEYIALSNSLSNYGLTNQGIIQAYIHEYQEETNSDNYPDVSYFKDEFIRVEGDIATEEPSLFIYKGDNLVGHVKLENTGDQLIEREVHVYTPGRVIGSFAYTKIAEMASQQGFQFRSDDQHSVAGTNLWEGLVRQDKAEKLNNAYYYKQQENKQSNQDQLSVIEPSTDVKKRYITKLNLDFKINEEDDIIIDAFYNGKKIGGMIIQKYGNEFFVRNVKSDFENQGIGTEIYKKAIEYATQQGGILKPDILSAAQSYSIYKKLEKIGLFKIDSVSEQLEDGRYEINGQSTGQLPIKEIISEPKQSDITTNFEQYFPDYAYLNGDERQVFIKGVESGDITITCTK